MSLNVNMLTKKSQVTIFILIGIIILIIAGMLFYLIRINTQTEIKEKAQKTTAEIISSEGIANYITSCLEDALINGTYTIGQQGGYIYKDQQGATINYNIQGINHEGVTVPLAIRPLTAITNIAPPWYPCSSSENAPDYCKFTNTGQSAYYYGERRQFPVLYKTQETTTKTSIQTQLKNFVEQETKKCANIKQLLTTEGLSTYNITEENPTAEIIFAETEIAVTLDYPITLKEHNKEPIKHLLRFFAKVPVRFKKIYYTAEDMITRDNLDLNYLMLENTTKGYYKEEQLNYNLLEQKASITQEFEGKTTIYTIKDTGSRIGNQQYYEFKFARQNRPPVLDYIPQQTINLTGPTVTHQFTISSTDPDETKTQFYSETWNDQTSPSMTLTESYIITPSTYQTNIAITANDYQIGKYTIDMRTTDGELEDWQETTIWICNNSNKIGRLPNICIDDCGATQLCNEKAIDEKINSCTINPVLEDKCSTTCQTTTSKTCIFDDQKGCTAPHQCDNLESYSIIPNEGWCYGEQGCSQFCQQPITDRQLNNPPYTYINASFECGCIQGARCDRMPYNLDFKGTCMNISGSMQCEGDTT